MELVGAWDPDVLAAILKLASIALPNLAGQVVVSMVMDPPKEGEPSTSSSAKSAMIFSLLSSVVPSRAGLSNWG